MGEYYIVANPDKRQYLNSNSLRMSVKLLGVMVSPLPRILVWLLADGGRFRGGGGWEAPGPVTGSSSRAMRAHRPAYRAGACRVSGHHSRGS